jgi:hypothetical protein
MPRVNSAGGALCDPKLARQLAAITPALDAVDARQRRQSAPVKQRGNPRGLTAHPQQNAFAVIEHLAGKAKLARDPPHGGPKAHALHASAHAHLKLRPRSDGHPITTALQAPITWC